MTRLDGTKTAYVDDEYFWRPISTAPLGAKLQLLTEGGVAIHGKLNRRDLTEGFYLGWTPLPKIPGDMK